MSARARANIRLPPEVCRSLFIRNLPYKISAEEMYDIFGKFGAAQALQGNASPGFGGGDGDVPQWLVFFSALCCLPFDVRCVRCFCLPPKPLTQQQTSCREAKFCVQGCKDKKDPSVWA